MMTGFDLIFVTQPSDGTWWPPAVVAAIVAGVISGAISFATFALSGRRARIDRQRQVFAEAFEAVIEYREYPFIVHRRRGDEPAAERARISTELSMVQAKLRGYEARLLVEDPAIGSFYREMVNETRRLAGPMIKNAWDAEPVQNDTQIHAIYDMTPLEESVDLAYLSAVRNHLSWVPWRR